MKKCKQLHQWLRVVCAMGVMLTLSATSWAANMKNNPIDAAETIDGFVISATTFSEANNSETTSKTSLTPSQVYWLNDAAQLTMSSFYSATTGTNYGSTSSPKYRITSGANSGYAAKLESNKNYLIFHASPKETEIATIKVTGYKPHTPVTVNFTIQELSASGRSQLRYIVNGEGQQQPIESASTNAFSFTYSNVSGSAFEKNELTILIRTDNWNEGDNCIYAISDFYVYGEVDALTAKIDVPEVKLGSSVQLSLLSNIDLDLSQAKWYHETDQGSSFIGTGANLTHTPILGKNYYYATWEGIGVYYTSNQVVATAFLGCSSESKVLFFEDFGSFDNENGSSDNPYVAYTYVGYNAPVKEGGQYAVLANASYGGCGKDGKESNTPCDDCSSTGTLKNQLWFRDLQDHTNDAEGKFGGLLLVNADESLVYSREVEVCPNTEMSFSAYFANASGGDEVSVKFFVKDENGEEISSATLVVEGIDYDEEWVRGETKFNSGTNQKVTVEIHSYNAASTAGNDFLVDDIAFTVCIPEIALLPTSNDEGVEIKDLSVSGNCGSSLTLTASAAAVEDAFTNPAYLWLVKSKDAEDFVPERTWDNLTEVKTTLSNMQVKVVVASTIENALEYVQSEDDNICVQVAVSEPVTIACVTPNLAVQATATGCNSYTLKATVNNSPSFVWQQSADNATWTPIEGKDNADSIQVEITSDTYYRVVADNSKSESIKLQFKSVELTLDKTEVLLGQEVSMQVAASFDTQSDVIWYENDKTIENEGYSYVVKPYATATYYVTIDQCQSNKVAIESVAWPTVFTPMLVDGFNDDFVVGMQPAIALSIYNRAGNLIAETTDGWDGKDAAGNYAMPGVYYFVATLSDGNVVKGNVELLVEKQK
jgi:hypothetical protein